MPDNYDYIVAVSSIEHVADEDSLRHTLMAVRDGIRQNGKAVIIMNTEVTETDANGVTLEPLIEINMPTDDLKNMVYTVFDGWTFEKETVVPQSWSIPRENGPVQMNTRVVTFVIKKA